MAGPTDREAEGEAAMGALAVGMMVAKVVRAVRVGKTEVEERVAAAREVARVKGRGEG